MLPQHFAHNANTNGQLDEVESMAPATRETAVATRTINIFELIEVVGVNDVDDLLNIDPMHAERPSEDADDNRFDFLPRFPHLNSLGLELNKFDYEMGRFRVCPGAFTTDIGTSVRPSNASIALRLNLHQVPGDRRGEYHGPNRFEKGATEDGFILFRDGSAFDRSLGKKYSSKEVLLLTEQLPLQTEVDSQPKTVKPSAPLHPFNWVGATKFPYYDRNGNLLFEVGRNDTPAGKQIRQRCLDDMGRWTYKLDGVLRPLYNLRDVAGAEMVVIVEGEKAADFLNSKLKEAGEHGRLVATTTSMGAGQAQKTDFSEGIQEKEIVILPDNDEPGAAHGEDLCRICAAQSRIKLINLPGLPPKGDVVDYFDKGGTVKGLLSLIVAAPFRQAGQPAAETGAANRDTAPPNGTEVGNTTVGSTPPTKSTPSGGDKNASTHATPTDTSNGKVPHDDAERPADPPRPRTHPSRSKRFKFRTLFEVMRWVELPFLIDGLLVAGSTSLITGKQSSFKSFFALDMAMSVATGEAFHGFPVHKGNVLFIAGEGADGAKARVGAWMAAHDFEPEEEPDGILFLDAAVQMADDEAVTDLILELNEIGVVLIVVDTLARAALELDENSARDMGRFMAGIARLSKATGAHVIVVHHNSKAGTYRGSSSLPAAVDTHLSVERKGDTVTLSTEKQKDSAQSGPLSFEVRKVTFPDRLVAGKDLESIVLKRIDVEPDTAGYHLSPLERRSLNRLVETSGNEGATQSEWLAACKIADIIDTNPRRTRRKLVEYGAIIIKDKNNDPIDQKQLEQLRRSGQQAVRYYPNPKSAWLTNEKS